ncbi:hypothetical protein [Pseudobacteriovorax antillogorgiicola]|uniref:Uncharacterized protein n=1 Tax=Pseudobacteriovorax antillogorgiicola TaxID=1513793 RepID=A0A1Y6CUA2_9BACT|nr:hypothetical protein [Pseudobacteriovorax antillogorgiicola]TCS44628.1 hypothetical protein EDD56_13261 [Pseudobacteriovorax antillogorgiicola]SMF78428.1 hypothetical protein SAMN06296036_13261 [Pseudobacteriovorax antillogorgiicola]
MSTVFKNVRTPASKKFHSLGYYKRRIEVIVPKRGKDKGKIKIVYESPVARRNVTLLAPIKQSHKTFSDESEARKYIREELREEVRQQHELATKAQKWQSISALIEVVEKFKEYLEAKNPARAKVDYDHFASTLTYFVGEMGDMILGNGMFILQDSQIGYHRWKDPEPMHLPLNGALVELS